VSDDPTIHTERLRLIELRAEAIKSLLKGDLITAGHLQGFAIPSEYLETIEDAFLENQLQRLLLRPSGRGWCVRVIIREGDDEVIGHCGFHGQPEDVGRAEMAYLIFESFRGNGYATEATMGLVNWAREQGVEMVFAAVSPENHSSIRVAERAGFHLAGVPGSESDGKEILFERNTYD
jgi:RimJ/RimL family protein N-acetyltransferase